MELDKETKSKITMKPVKEIGSKKKNPMYDFKDLVPNLLELSKVKNIDKTKKKYYIKYDDKPVYVLTKPTLDHVEIVNDTKIYLYTTIPNEAEFNKAIELDNFISKKLNDLKYNSTEVYNSFIKPNSRFREPALIRWTILFNEESCQPDCLMFYAGSKDKLDIKVDTASDILEKGLKSTIVGQIQNIEIDTYGSSILNMTIYQIVISELKERIPLNSYIGGSEQIIHQDIIKIVDPKTNENIIVQKSVDIQKSQINTIQGILPQEIKQNEAVQEIKK